MHGQHGEIVIDPVTRIEGHSKITIYLDDDGRVPETARVADRLATVPRTWPRRSSTTWGSTRAG